VNVVLQYSVNFEMMFDGVPMLPLGLLGVTPVGFVRVWVAFPFRIVPFVTAKYIPLCCRLSESKFFLKYSHNHLYLLGFREVFSH
jgi:hypothetical protein